MQSIPSSHYSIYPSPHTPPTHLSLPKLTIPQTTTLNYNKSNNVTLTFTWRSPSLHTEHRSSPSPSSNYFFLSNLAVILILTITTTSFWTEFERERERGRYDVGDRGERTLACSFLHPKMHYNAPPPPSPLHYKIKAYFDRIFDRKTPKIWPTLPILTKNDRSKNSGRNFILTDPSQIVTDYFDRKFDQKNFDRIFYYQNRPKKFWPIFWPPYSVKIWYFDRFLT